MSLAHVEHHQQLPIAIHGRGTLEESLSWLLTHGLIAASNGTRRYHQGNARYLMLFFGRGTPLSELTYERLCEYRDKEGPRGRGVMYLTIRHRLSTLHMALKEAHRRGIIPALPAWPKVPQDHRPGTRTLGLADFRRLVAYEGWRPEQRLWLQLAFFTGQRKHDLDTMRWCHVDLEQKVFLRRSTKTRALAEPFPLHEELHAALVVEAERTQAGPTKLIAGEWINVVHDLARACRALGIERVTPNDIRRSCESHLRAAGANPEFVRLMLCHSEAIARKNYIRTTPRLLAEGAEALKKL